MHNVHKYYKLKNTRNHNHGQQAGEHLSNSQTNTIAHTSMGSISSSLYIAGEENKKKSVYKQHCVII